MTGGDRRRVNKRVREGEGGYLHVGEANALTLRAVLGTAFTVCVCVCVCLCASGYTMAHIAYAIDRLTRATACARSVQLCACLSICPSACHTHTQSAEGWDWRNLAT